jgi:FtsP/CotA-like multicopper oxidase with cupredoxin domain
VLGYADLRATRPGGDPRPPTHEITLRLTGNMERFIWGFDGKKFSEVPPIGSSAANRTRFELINDTMMEHSIHLHGLERAGRGNSRTISPSSTKGDSGKRRVLRDRRAKARATFVSFSASASGSEGA